MMTMREYTMSISQRQVKRIKQQEEMIDATVEVPFRCQRVMYLKL